MAYARTGENASTNNVKGNSLEDFILRFLREGLQWKAHSGAKRHEDLEWKTRPAQAGHAIICIFSLCVIKKAFYTFGAESLLMVLETGGLFFIV